MHVCACVHACACEYVHLHACVHVCACVRACVHASKCTRVCVCVWCVCGVSGVCGVCGVCGVWCVCVCVCVWCTHIIVMTISIIKNELTHKTYHNFQFMQKPYSLIKPFIPTCIYLVWGRSENICTATNQTSLQTQNYISTWIL